MWSTAMSPTAGQVVHVICEYASALHIIESVDWGWGGGGGYFREGGQEAPPHRKLRSIGYNVYTSVHDIKCALTGRLY